ncbi:hypothetical protein DY000_02027609 [Brassica cretica]|uniref:Secreted protein n=1 Tax=Brassica cretica TaxID=69181 RepID=A0ABQ7E1K6_BRACR|nr:hypothetical protein DY000_02027609 [Brassica cretica]
MARGGGSPALSSGSSLCVFFETFCGVVCVWLLRIKAWCLAFGSGMCFFSVETTVVHRRRVHNEHRGRVVAVSLWFCTCIFRVPVVARSISRMAAERFGAALHYSLLPERSLVISPCRRLGGAISACGSWCPFLSVLRLVWYGWLPARFAILLPLIIESRASWPVKSSRILSIPSYSCDVTRSPASEATR